jgi:hypothetical protein
MFEKLKMGIKKGNVRIKIKIIHKQKKEVLGTEISETKITKICFPETRIHGNVRNCMIETEKDF